MGQLENPMFVRAIENIIKTADVKGKASSIH